eukprot:983813-Pelagomonas_calceolata.AAC.4
MGIKDLLKRLDPIARDVSLREYKGSVLALDTSCLLHRRAALTPREHVLDSQDSNAFEVAPAVDDKTPNQDVRLPRSLIPTCMDQGSANWTEERVSKSIRQLHSPSTLVLDALQIRFLRKHGIEPILVFDGDALPMKAAEEEKRNRFVHHLRHPNMLTSAHLKNLNKELLQQTFDNSLAPRCAAAGFANQASRRHVSWRPLGMFSVLKSIGGRQQLSNHTMPSG